jgi:hypothetical protein
MNQEPPMLELFLSQKDQSRCELVLERVTRHETDYWILTGGLAIEIQLIRRGARPARRTLNDIDFVTSSFTLLPPSLKSDFLFRHVHPDDPPGKTVLQAVDPQEALRIDVFNDGGVALPRAEKVELSGSQVSIISVEDLYARAARLSLSIVHGEAIAKHAEDFYRLSKLATVKSVECVWQFHRRPDQPSTFREACDLLHYLLPLHQKNLITPKYSNDGTEVCKRCKPTVHFPLADPKTIHSILGYY